MITMEVRMNKTIKGLKNYRVRLRKSKRHILKEAGMKTKQYARMNIQNARARFTGRLIAGMHYRTAENKSTVWNDAPHSIFWEFGVTPHFIHRNMMSAAGYPVGSWMNAKGINPRRNFILVGAKSPLGQGIHFMENAYHRIQAELPTIILKHMKRVK